jgi:diacylglycerol kinase family enzyme
MKLEDFAVKIWDICTHTPLMPGRPLRWIIIANPKAGGFMIPSRWRRHYRSLVEYAVRARALSRRDNAVPFRTAMDEGEDDSLGSLGFIPTCFAGHAGKITEILLKEAAAELAIAPSKPFYLVICAGGDGTGLEVQTVLCNAAPEIRENFAVVRFPMGTGNDGADTRELAGALDLLLCPSRIEPARALRLTTATAGKGPFLAFNILSVGLDAFVTHMTNKMKGRLPGDFYKLWVDIASLFYDKLYTVGPLDIRSFDDTGPAEEKVLRETVLLMAMGASGHRTYGSNKRILPDDRNVCIVRQMPLLRKVALKGLFTTGAHANKKESLLFNSRRIEFRGEHPMLAQMDGESVLLQPEDFPAVIELTEPVIPVLKKL